MKKSPPSQNLLVFSTEHVEQTDALQEILQECQLENDCFRVEKRGDTAVEITWAENATLRLLIYKLRETAVFLLQQNKIVDDFPISGARMAAQMPDQSPKTLADICNNLSDQLLPLQMQQEEVLQNELQKFHDWVNDQVQKLISVFDEAKYQVPFLLAKSCQEQGIDGAQSQTFTEFFLENITSVMQQIQDLQEQIRQSPPTNSAEIQHQRKIFSEALFRYKHYFVDLFFQRRGLENLGAQYAQILGFYMDENNLPSRKTLV